jgi:hypothetical protein
MSVGAVCINLLTLHPAQIRTGHHVSTPYSSASLAPSLFPSRPGTLILMDCRSEGSLMVNNCARRRNSKDIHSQCRPELITINMLHDNVLLEIFNLYVIEGFRFRHPSKTRRRQGGISLFETLRIQEWIMLVHICRRWRTIVFQSPHRLNLRLLCTYKTPARDTHDVWPPLPLWPSKRENTPFANINI